MKTQLRVPGSEREPGVWWRDRRAFTLSELLIVIGLCIVLVAIATPAAMRVAENGRSAECVGRMQHLAVAMTQFRAERNQIMWDLKAVSEGGEGGISPAQILYRYGVIRSGREMCCPSAGTAAKGAWKTGGSGDASYMRDISNQYISYAANGMAIYQNSPWKVPNLIRSFLTFAGSESRTPLFMDGYAFQLNINFWQPNQRFSYVALRHRDRANVLFLDGHVESLNHHGVERLDPYGGTNPAWLNDFGVN